MLNIANNITNKLYRYIFKWGASTQFWRANTKATKKKKHINKSFKNILFPSQFHSDLFSALLA